MPYWRLSTFYLCYFGALGILVPYWGLYLKHLGFSAAQIGELMAIPMATKIFAPYLWGWLGDHLGQRMSIVRAGTLLTLIVFLLVFWLTSYWGLALAMALFSFFWNAVLPLFEVVALGYLGNRSARYAQIRAWGSIGFILAVILLGMAVDRFGPSIVPLALFTLYLAIWLSSLTLQDPYQQPHPPSQPSIISVLRHPAILAFFAACFLLQAGHAVYYSFYSIYMEANGYSKTLIGWYWSVGVIAEVIVFLIAHRLLHRLGARQLLIASLLLAALRWIIIGWFPQSLTMLFAAQTLHAFSFGTFHAAAIHLVQRYFTGRHQGRGQAIYAGVSFGAGGAFGSLLAGYLWESAGPSTSFEWASLASLLAAFIVWRWTKKET